MKNLKNIHYWCFVIALVILFNSCKKEFLEKTPTDSIVDANFYKTNDQVLASTALLYSRVWFDYNDKASFNIGDFRAGTVSSAYTKIFDPNPPPTSGATTRILCSGLPSTNAHISRRST